MLLQVIVSMFWTIYVTPMFVYLFSFGLNVEPFYEIFYPILTHKKSTKFQGSFD